ANRGGHSPHNCTSQDRQSQKLSVRSTMSIELTDDQSRALELEGQKPCSVVDPRTRKTYVLLSLEAFDKIKAIVPDGEAPLSDTYPAQIDSAMKAGWDDPLMTAYDHYD